MSVLTVPTNQFFYVLHPQSTVWSQSCSEEEEHAINNGLYYYIPYYRGIYNRENVIVTFGKREKIKSFYKSIHIF